MDHVKDLWSSYLQWVAEHPQLATDIETSIKWISYIATGKKQWTLWFLSKTFLTKIQNCISKKSEKENLLLPTFCMVSQNSWMVCNVFPIQIFWTVVQIVLTIMLWQVFVCFTAPILNFCQESKIAIFWPPLPPFMITHIIHGWFLRKVKVLILFCIFTWALAILQE